MNIELLSLNIELLLLNIELLLLNIELLLLNIELLLLNIELSLLNIELSLYTNSIKIEGFQPRTPIRGSGGKIFSVWFSLGSIACVAVSIVEFTYSRKVVSNFLFIQSGIHIKSS